MLSSLTCALWLLACAPTPSLWHSHGKVSKYGGSAAGEVTASLGIVMVGSRGIHSSGAWRHVRWAEHAGLSFSCSSMHAWSSELSSATPGPCWHVTTSLHLPSCSCAWRRWGSTLWALCARTCAGLQMRRPGSWRTAPN